MGRLFSYLFLYMEGGEHDLTSEPMFLRGHGEDRMITYSIDMLLYFLAFSVRS